MGKDFSSKGFARMTNRELLNNFILASMTGEEKALALEEIDSRFEYYVNSGVVPGDDTAASTYLEENYLDVVKAASQGRDSLT